MLILTESNL